MTHPHVDAAPPLSAADLDRLRADTPGCRERIHLDNAGAALMPRPVIDEIKSHLDLESRFGGYEAAEARAAAIEDTYCAMADLLGTAPRNIAWMENATAAFAQALSAVPFAPGDVVLTTRNDYISNQLMYLSLKRRLGIEVVRAPDTPAGGVDVDAVETLIRRHRPKLVAVTQVPTNSGLVQPTAAIGTLCRTHEVPYLVDACQSVGQLPVDAEAMGCDFLSGTCRKFLRGPRGAGFLYVADRALAAGWMPLFVDMRGADWTAADDFQLQPTARRFENWEFAYGLVLASGEAARYAGRVGIESIAARSTALASTARRGLATIDGVRLLDRGSELSAIVTFDVQGWQPEPFQQALRDRRITTSLSYRRYSVLDFEDKNAQWAVRVSPHYYNTEREIETLVETVRELVAG